METIGFLGIGTMGEPMVLNLLKGGHPVLAWNRTRSKTATIEAAGAEIAPHPGDVFARCQIVLAMFADGSSLDVALGRGTPEFAARMSGRTLVNMATMSADYSKELSEAVRAAGGRFVEAPVSGSRKPAEAGQLVAMLAGEPDAIKAVKPILKSMCRQMVECGPVPSAILLKMSTNLFQIAMITALSEAVNFVVKNGLSIERFNEVILSGQLASDMLRAKAPKYLNRNFEAQAAIRNVYESNRLAVEAAKAAGVPTPLSDVCLCLNQRAMEQGLGDEDMIAVLKAYEAMAR